MASCSQSFPNHQNLPYLSCFPLPLPASSIPLYSLTSPLSITPYFYITFYYSNGPCFFSLFLSFRVSFPFSSHQLSYISHLPSTLFSLSSILLLHLLPTLLSVSNSHAHSFYSNRPNFLVPPFLFSLPPFMSSFTPPPPVPLPFTHPSLSHQLGRVTYCALLALLYKPSSSSLLSVGQVTQ